MWIGGGNTPPKTTSVPPPSLPVRKQGPRTWGWASLSLGLKLLRWSKNSSVAEPRGWSSLRPWTLYGCCGSQGSQRHVDIGGGAGLADPLFKKENRGACSNYRGITLLRLSSKVYLGEEGRPDGRTSGSRGGMWFLSWMWDSGLVSWEDWTPPGLLYQTDSVHNVYKQNFEAQPGC